MTANWIDFFLRRRLVDRGASLARLSPATLLLLAAPVGAQTLPPKFRVSYS